MTEPATEIPQDAALNAWLRMITGSRQAGLIETRHRLDRREGMGQMFSETAEIKTLVHELVRLSSRTDVYVGAAPRTHRHGGTAAIDTVWTLWADCDGDEAVAALERFRPIPAVVVLSGSEENRHAYWPLREPLTPDHAARANRRLAHALGADMRSTDAARILRPPGTLNWKQRDTPRPVRCIQLEVVSYLARDVVGALPDPPEPKLRALHAPRDYGDDALLSLPATVYVPALSGRPLNRDKKICCPFHEDRTPSLHAYPDDGGWHCFGGCGGGTIIDFGARLYGIEPRGSDYYEIRRRLAADILGAKAA